MIDFEPPIVGCVISNRNHSFGMLKATKECVINIPTVELAAQVVACGNSSGRSLDKFEAFHLTPMRAAVVQAPLIAECYANLECRVVDASMVTRYNLFILEVLKAWVDPSRKRPRTIHHLGRGSFMVAGRTIKLPSRMKLRLQSETERSELGLLTCRGMSDSACPHRLDSPGHAANPGRGAPRSGGVSNDLVNIRRCNRNSGSAASRRKTVSASSSFGPPPFAW